MSRDRANANDLAQVPVERALRSKAKWLPGTRLDSWLFRIMRNLWFDTVRARARKQKVEAPVEEADSLGEDPRGAVDAGIELKRARTPLLVN